MYYKYFGLKEAPFSIAPNPDYLFMTERHREALAHLHHCIESDAGFVMLTGDIGTGKTTVCRLFLNKLPDDTQVAFILNPFLGGKELLFSIAQELQIEELEENATLRESVDAIYLHLLRNYSKKRHTILLIDEAQHIHSKVLELIRLLTNLETDRKKLLKIILVGQPELNDILAQEDMVQLSQRITARYHIKPLSLEETRAYIDYRMRTAGFMGELSPFPKTAVKQIYQYTKGVPRLINVLCDRVLLGVYSQNKALADSEIIKKAFREVKGVEPKKRQWLYPLSGALAGVLVVSLALWLFMGKSDQSLNQEGDIAQMQPQVNQANGAVPAPSQSVTATAAHTLAVTSVEEPPRQLQYFTDKAAALRGLFPQMLGSKSQVVKNCTDIILTGWQCDDVTLSAWNQVRGLNRPGIITTRQNFQDYYYIVLGINNTHIQFLFEGESAWYPMDEIKGEWTGTFTYLWQPPKDFEKYIYFDSSASSVKWLAEAFARIDQRDEKLADSAFNSLLKQRIILFQKEHNLLPDGIAGVQTLLKINEALGVAKTLNEEMSEDPAKKEKS